MLCLFSQRKALVLTGTLIITRPFMISHSGFRNEQLTLSKLSALTAAYHALLLWKP
jgi:hypothetical protein